MVAALAQLHHCVEQVGDVAVTTCSQAEEAEVPLQDGSVVFLLDVCQLNLREGRARRWLVSCDSQHYTMFTINSHNLI